VEGGAFKMTFPYFPQAEPAVFAAIDLNKDGNIDHDEWHKFKEAHGLKHT